MKFPLNTIRSNVFGLLAATLVVVPATLQAASINYGSFVGTSVTYQNVTETSPTDPLPMFGAPTLIGNTLDFNPQNFTSFSANGATDQTDGQLNFLIQANQGSAIPSVMFSEAGDFTLSGAGTAATRASVTATFFIDIYAVDGVNLAAPVTSSALMTFSPLASGIFDLGTYSGTTLWSGSFNFNVNAALTGAGVSYNHGATLMSVVLDNILVTESELGTSARISKKDFKGLGITVPVPEPSILALTLCGAGLIFARRRASR